MPTPARRNHKCQRGKTQDRELQWDISSKVKIQNKKAQPRMAVPLSDLPTPASGMTLFPFGLKNAELLRVRPAVPRRSQIARRGEMIRIRRFRLPRISRSVFAGPSRILTAWLCRGPTRLIRICRLRLPRSGGAVFATPSWILTAGLRRGSVGLIRSGRRRPARCWPTRARSIWTSWLAGAIRRLAWATRR